MPYQFSETTTLRGHGFVVTDVPRYLDEACKASVSKVFKTEQAALKAADAEAAAWHLDYVEGAVAVQIDDYEGLWFVVVINTDWHAENCLKHVTFNRNWIAKREAEKAAAQQV